jgi:hypothetical protein
VKDFASCSPKKIALVFLFYGIMGNFFSPWRFFVKKDPKHEHTEDVAGQWGSPFSCGCRSAVRIR